MSALCSRVLKMMNDPAKPKWTKPWAVGGESTPTNPFTGTYYGGANWFRLTGEAAVQGYSTGVWATSNNWKKSGCRIKKGSEGVPIYKHRWFKRCCKDENCNDGSICGERNKSGPGGLEYVFNADQIEGAKPDHPLKSDGTEMSDDAVQRARVSTASLMKAGAQVTEGGDKACYIPSMDVIRMPPARSFDSVEAYASTLAHEHVHWTGHADRMGRDQSGAMGSESYAREELVAELGAAMLCSELGIESVERDDHASYLAHWAELLGDENGPQELEKAMVDAGKAVAWVKKEIAEAEEAYAASPQLLPANPPVPQPIAAMSA